MSHDLGGRLWLFIDVILVVVLAGALIFGAVQWRRWKKHPVATEERDRATREAYRR